MKKSKQLVNKLIKLKWKKVQVTVVINTSFIYCYYVCVKSEKIVTNQLRSFEKQSIADFLSVIKSLTGGFFTM